MKLFSLLLSVAVFFITLYFLVIQIPLTDTSNDIIYVLLLCLLMVICVVGVIINWEFFDRFKRRR